MTPLKILIVLIFLIYANFNFAKSIAVELENIEYSQVLRADFREADKTLRYGIEDLQFGKLWLPKNTDLGDATPLVVFIHGGCWLNAYSIEHSYPLTSALADSGVMVWSLEYRRTGDEGGGWPGTFEDIRQGIQFILSQHAELNIDPKRIYVMGHSAGGHLAILANDVGIANHNKNFNINVIGLAAISDIIQYGKGTNSCQTAVSDFMGGQYSQTGDVNKGDEHMLLENEYESANPQNFDNVTLLHGDKDQIVPLSQSTESGAKVIVIQGAGHFDYLHPKTVAFDVLLKQIN